MGTPVMSVMAMDEPVSTIRCSRFSITTCARAVQRADQRQGENTLPELYHRGREFQQFLLLAGDEGFAVFLERLSGIQP